MDPGGTHRTGDDERGERSEDDGEDRLGSQAN
jgi:hypothetical protein